MVSASCFGYGVGVVVFVDQEHFGLCKFGVIVLMSFDLGAADGAMSPGVGDLLVCAPDVTIVAEHPWPSVKVGGLIGDSV